MNLLEPFQSFISTEKLFTKADRLLLAVSGGVDSVVLSELCHRAGYDFGIAHCNFQLRGEESRRDEEFVRSLGQQLNVKVYVRHFDTEAYATAHKMSVQEAARELRYSWFDELLRDPLNGFKYILTAHQIDDSVETSLMNLFKGTGIAGLRGILPRRERLIRPLLFARKEELLTFARENGLSWVEDSSNSLDKYTRNFFRHQVIPLIQTVYPAAESNLAQNLRRFRETELLYRQAIDRHRKKLLLQKGSEWQIPVARLQQVQPLHTVLYELIRDFGFQASQTAEVAALLDSGTGRYIQSAGYRIIRHRAWLIISPVLTEEAGVVPIDEMGSFVFREGTLLVEQEKAPPGVIDPDPDAAFLDAAAIEFPLILRPWKTGDYFYPLGMQKKKKLARFFIDQKLSLAEKERVWVIEMNKKIVWIVGKRMDDRFRVKPSTTAVIRISFRKHL